MPKALDIRAIATKGAQGVYRCEHCGKTFTRLMSKALLSKKLFCSKQCKIDHQWDKPRTGGCWVDPRALSHEGQWGVYLCDKCGKQFKARMPGKKNKKNVFCSTRCKKDYYIRTDLAGMSDKTYRKIYLANYDLVMSESFQVLNGRHLHMLEDCMQEGFIELWKIYNRNECKCSTKYIRKSVHHAILSRYVWWRKQEDRYIPVSNILHEVEELKLVFAIEKGREE